MSALAGFWNWAGTDRPDQRCRAILAAQLPCAPDGQDVRSTDSIALGRGLYKLLPEDDHDRQPLCSGDGSLVMVADVRLDNRADLLGRLGSTASDARGLSDADVLLAAYERWGEGSLDLLNGDFAFAIWDRRRGKLILARDPLGLRPLHYHHASRFFAFSSRPAGLHALAGVSRRADMATLADFVGLVPIEGSAGFYQSVDRVEAGHVVTVTPSGVAARRYWTPQPTRLGWKSFDEYTEAFRAELDRSVRVRLRTRGDRVATHLSGGWDSSAVTATVARLRGPGESVLAYTSVPRPGSRSGAAERSFGNEGALAAATAALYPQVEHVRIAGAAKSPFDDLDRYVAAFERPVYNLSNHVWITDIRQHARARGARLLLTGELGNWTISSAHYTVLADYIREGRWLDWLREAWALGLGGSARLRGIAANSFGPWLPQYLWQRVRALSSRPEATLATALHPGLAAQVEQRREASGVGLASRPKNYHLAAAAGLSGIDLGDYRKGALAGWGVDERDPTSDRQLIDFCLSLPIDMLLKNGVRRPLARAALSDRLPPAVLDEKRKGYQAADWHEGLTNARPQILALLEEIASDSQAAALLDIESLRRWTREWPGGNWANLEIMDRYRRALPIALTAGHFIISTKG